MRGSSSLQVLRLLWTAVWQVTAGVDASRSCGSCGQRCGRVFCHHWCGCLQVLWLLWTAVWQVFLPLLVWMPPGLVALVDRCGRSFCHYWCGCLQVLWLWWTGVAGLSATTGVDASRSCGSGGQVWQVFLPLLVWMPPGLVALVDSGVAGLSATTGVDASRSCGSCGQVWQVFLPLLVWMPPGLVALVDSGLAGLSATTGVDASRSCGSCGQRSGRSFCHYWCGCLQVLWLWWTGVAGLSATTGVDASRSCGSCGQRCGRSFCHYWCGCLQVLWLLWTGVAGLSATTGVDASRSCGSCGQRCGRSFCHYWCGCLQVLWLWWTGVAGLSATTGGCLQVLWLWWTAVWQVFLPLLVWMPPGLVALVDRCGRSFCHCWCGCLQVLWLLWTAVWQVFMPLLVWMPPGLVAIVDSGVAGLSATAGVDVSRSCGSCGQRCGRSFCHCWCGCLQVLWLLWTAVWQVFLPLLVWMPPGLVALVDSGVAGLSATAGVDASRSCGSYGQRCGRSFCHCWCGCLQVLWLLWTAGVAGLSAPAGVDASRSCGSCGQRCGRSFCHHWCGCLQVLWLLWTAVWQVFLPLLVWMPPGLVDLVDSGVAGLSATAGVDERMAVTIATPEYPVDKRLSRIS